MKKKSRCGGKDNTERDNKVVGRKKMKSDIKFYIYVIEKLTTANSYLDSCLKDTSTNDSMVDIRSGDISLSSSSGRQLSEDWLLVFHVGYKTFGWRHLANSMQHVYNKTAQ